MPEIKASGTIFIMGIMPRSGTHFLANLLCRHPDCEKSVIAEDGLIANADFLTRYAACLQNQWNEQMDISNLMPKQLLLENLGEGLLNFLRRAKETAFLKTNKNLGVDRTIDKSSKRLVTKTPSVKNLDKFFKLFPNEKLLIIVRDGRAVVESNANSFNSDREEAAREWAKAARKIFDFEENQSSKKFLIIEYEKLHADTEIQMRKILDFLELDAGKFDFPAALNLPVVGSSTFKRGEGPVHWLPVMKTEKFQPLARAVSWTRAQHERFNWLAKDELIKLGYEPKEFGCRQLRWKVWNTFKDFKWEAKIWFRRIPKLFRFVGKRFKIYFHRNDR